jgi:ferric-dicitrate binding protein FerR (iron transport regulator)
MPAEPYQLTTGREFETRWKAMEHRRPLKRRFWARALVWVSLCAAATLLATACNRGRDQSDDGSAGEGFRLSLSKRDAPLFDGNTAR